MKQNNSILHMAIAALAIVQSTNAAAASLLEAIVFGQAQQQTTAGEIVACGVTVSAIEKPPGTPVGRTLVFNGSIMIYGPAGGLVKGRVADIDAKAVASGNLDVGLLKTLPSERIWMKAPNVAATEPNVGTTITKSEDPGYSLYASGFTATWGVIHAILEKAPIQIGFKVKSKNIEQVLFGEVQMPESQRAQLEQCLGEWSTSISKKYKAEPSKEESK